MLLVVHRNCIWTVVLIYGFSFQANWFIQSVNTNWARI